MQKVKFLKDFLQYAKGDTAEVTPERAKYFELTKVAEPVKEKKEDPKTTKTPKK